VSYLHPIMDRKNLSILTDHWVTRILFDENNRALGVEYLDNAFDRTATLMANREVIVSAGAIDTPKLLMLSGIGPAEHLQVTGVDVRIDAPGVGSNLQDHPEAVISWESNVPMTREATQWWEIGIFSATEEGLELPDLMMHYGSVPFSMHTRRHGYPPADESFALTPNVTHAKSRGTVRLRSRDYADKPKVDPRYFTDPEGHDMRVAVEGIKLARKIVAQPAMAEFAGRELFPGTDVQSDDDIAAYVSKTHNTVYHPAGSCRMGPVDVDSSPLDPQLRVKRTTGLRVVDASAMPQLPAVNPNITVMLMGERAADLIKADQKQLKALGGLVPFGSRPPFFIRLHFEAAQQAWDAYRRYRPGSIFVSGASGDCHRPIGSQLSLGSPHRTRRSLLPPSYHRRNRSRTGIHIVRCPTRISNRAKHPRHLGLLYPALHRRSSDRSNRWPFQYPRSAQFPDQPRPHSQDRS